MQRSKLFFTLSKQIAKGLSIPSDFPRTVLQRLYHTNNTTNTVSCHKINGDKLWEFQDVAIIREPHGVAVDRDLNVKELFLA
jgi:hypothetical protein